MRGFVENVMRVSLTPGPMLGSATNSRIRGRKLERRVDVETPATRHCLSPATTVVDMLECLNTTINGYTFQRFKSIIV